MGRIQKRDQYAGLINLIMEIIENRDLQYNYSSNEYGIDIHSFNDMISIAIRITFEYDGFIYRFCPFSMILNKEAPIDLMFNIHKCEKWYEATKLALLNHIEK